MAVVVCTKMAPILSRGLTASSPRTSRWTQIIAHVGIRVMLSVRTCCTLGEDARDAISTAVRVGNNSERRAPAGRKSKTMVAKLFKLESKAVAKTSHPMTRKKAKKSTKTSATFAVSAHVFATTGVIQKVACPYRNTSPHQQEKKQLLHCACIQQYSSMLIMLGFVPILRPGRTDELLQAGGVHATPCLLQAGFVVSSCSSGKTDVHRRSARLAADGWPFFFNRTSDDASRANGRSTNVKLHDSGGGASTAGNARYDRAGSLHGRRGNGIASA